MHGQNHIKIEIYIHIKGTVCQVSYYLSELYRAARSPEYKKSYSSLVIRSCQLMLTC